MTEILSKLLSFLSNNEKKQLFNLVVLMIFMALLDVVGIASIMPFMMVMINPDLIDTNIYLKNIFNLYKSFGFDSKTKFLFILGLITFVLLVLSLIFKSLITYLQLRFSLLREYSIGKRLMDFYLHQPYSWFLRKHSSDLSKSVLSEVSTVTHHAIAPAINIISQFFVALAIFVLLMIVNFKISIIAIILFGLSYFFVFLLVNGYLSDIGTKRLKINSDRFKIVSEAFNTIKFLKISRTENLYLNKFGSYAHDNATLHATSQVISQLPRYLLEIIAFGGILLLTLFALNLNNNTLAIPTLALYAFAGYRLMPIMQQIYYSATQFRFAAPAINSIYNDLIKIKSFRASNDNDSCAFKGNIKLNNVSYSYPETDIFALKNISLEIQPNTFSAIVGTTGSGKTTLIDIILGLLEPVSGTLEIDKTIIRLSTHNTRNWQACIGYVPQDIKLLDTSVYSNIAFGLDLNQIDQDMVQSAAKIANIHEFIINELPQGYNTFIGENGVRLSGGQRQRIGIARALYYKPKILVLDEATSALDSQTEYLVLNSIEKIKKDITVILVTHRITTIKNCDKIFLLQNGKLHDEGNYQNLSISSKLFQSMITKII